MDLFELSDATLRTEDGHLFPIHRFFLAKRSKYFLALFTYPGNEKKKDIVISDIGGEVMSNVLSHLYGGDMLVNEGNLCDLILASDYLALEDLLSYLKTHLASHLSTGNCLPIFTTANKIHQMDVLKESYRFIQTHFQEIVCIDSEIFCKLPPEFLKQFLADKNLRVESETVVWLAIVKWVEADRSNRLADVPVLMTCLKVDDVDEQLASEILQHQIVAENKFCETVNPESGNYSTNLLNFKQLIFKICWSNARQITWPFNIHRKPPFLYLVARYCTKFKTEGIQIFVTYDENIDLWRKVTEVNRSPDYMLLVNDCIYVFEAEERRHFRFSISEKQWHELDSFTVPRRNYAVVKLHGLIFVLGGMSVLTGGEMYDVDVYDPERNAWYSTTPLHPVTYFSAISLYGSIFVTGSRSRFAMYQMIAQEYNLLTEVWTVLPDPSVTRFEFALVAYRGMIYAIGGSNGSGMLKDVEVYDPVNSIWHTTTSLPHVYYFPRAVVINDDLIVYDNHLEDRTYLKTNPPVKWNAGEERWDIIEESSPLCKIYMYYFYTFDDTEGLSAVLSENRDSATIFEKSPFSV